MFADLRKVVKGDQILATDHAALVNAVNILAARPWSESETFVRFRLEEDLYNCSSASATVLDDTGEDESDGECACVGFTDGESITVGDRIGAVSGSALGRGGYVRSGMWGVARLWPDSGQYEPLVFGDPECGSESSESESSESSQSESSESSQSESSESRSESSQSGSEESGSGGSGSEESGSEESGSGGSGSEESGSEESGSGGSGSEESGESKSTAIVPASWSPTGFTALSVFEDPTPRFGDVASITLTQTNCRVAIDPKWLEVCEPGGIEVFVQPKQPVVVGACVESGEICLEFAEQRSDRVVTLAIRLIGTRKGFAAVRFPDRTKEEFDANEAYLKMAKPHA
jgi:hypothetical protein